MWQREQIGYITDLPKLVRKNKAQHIVPRKESLKVEHRQEWNRQNERVPKYLDDKIICIKRSCARFEVLKHEDENKK